jgi:hypothetical protein
MRVTIPFALWLLLSSLSSLSSSSQVDIEALWQHPVDFSQMKGTFVQLRSIAQLPIPLRSSGEFEYDPKGSLNCQVMVPVKSQVMIYRDRIVQIDPNGESLELNAREYPHIRVMSEIFFSVFTGKLSNEHFHISQLSSDDGWHLNLIPADELLSKQIVSIDLFGESQLARFVMVESNGDQVVINFQQLSYQ